MAIHRNLFSQTRAMTTGMVQRERLYHARRGARKTLRTETRLPNVLLGLPNASSCAGRIWPNTGRCAYHSERHNTVESLPKCRPEWHSGDLLGWPEYHSSLQQKPVFGNPGRTTACTAGGLALEKSGSPTCRRQAGPFFNWRVFGRISRAHRVPCPPRQRPGGRNRHPGVPGPPISSRECAPARAAP